jgi:hypothetical protein
VPLVGAGDRGGALLNKIGAPERREWTWLVGPSLVEINSNNPSGHSRCYHYALPSTPGCQQQPPCHVHCFHHHQPMTRGSTVATKLVVLWYKGCAWIVRCIEYGAELNDGEHGEELEQAHVILLRFHHRRRGIRHGSSCASYWR